MARRLGREGGTHGVWRKGAVLPRRRFGPSEIPQKVLRIVAANVLGGIGFGYLMVFITAYLPRWNHG